MARQGKYKRLPDFIEDRRLDTIALTLEIERMLDRQLEALLRGDSVEAARLGGEMRMKAMKIRRLMQEMKRLATGGNESWNI